jgi:hypothetical protein
LAAAADAVLRLIGAFARLRPFAARDLRLERAWPSPAELDELFMNPPAAPAAGVRDRDFLEWRFARSPVFRYDVRFVYKAGRLAGYVASRRTVYGGYDTAFVVDAFGSPLLDARDWSEVAWRLMGEQLRADGPALLMIVANLTAGPLAALARAPFIRVPKGRLPQPAPVFAQWWSAPRFAFAADSLALSLADCDML